MQNKLFEKAKHKNISVKRKQQWQRNHNWGGSKEQYFKKLAVHHQNCSSSCCIILCKYLMNLIADINIFRFFVSPNFSSPHKSGLIRMLPLTVEKEMAIFLIHKDGSVCIIEMAVQELVLLLVCLLNDNLLSSWRLRCFYECVIFIDALLKHRGGCVLLLIFVESRTSCNCLVRSELKDI